MGSAAAAAYADGNSVDPQGERNICVRRRAFDTRLIADKLVGGAKCGEQRRISRQFPARTAPEKLDLPFQLAFRAVARRFRLIADARGDTFAQRGFEACQLVL